MRNLILLMALCLLPALAGGEWGEAALLRAQQAAPEALIKNIRARYAEAMSNANQQLAGESMEGKNYSQSTFHYVIPGCGPTTETLSYYYQLNDEPEEDVPTYLLYLVTRKYNVAALQFYEEYLFDPETDKPLFVYYKYDNYDAPDGAAAEERYYMDDGKIVWHTANEYGDRNDAAVLRACHRLMQAFSYLLNSSF